MDINFSQQPPTILVAEDDPNDRLLLQRALGQVMGNASIHFVPDGQAVIDYLQSQALGAAATPERVPPLLLLDLRLPGRSGLEVLKWIVSQPGLRRMSVVVLSSSADPRDVSQATALGACDYLVKPTQSAGLIALLKRLEPYWSRPGLPGFMAPRAPYGAAAEPGG